MNSFDESILQMDLTHYIYFPNRQLFKFKGKAVRQNAQLADEIIIIMKTIQDHNIHCEFDRFHNILLS